MWLIRLARLATADRRDVRLTSTVVAKDNTIMTSFNNATGSSAQAAPKALRTSVTIVIAGSAPLELAQEGFPSPILSPTKLRSVPAGETEERLELPQGTVNAVGRSTSGRLDMNGAARSGEFAQAQVPGLNNALVPGVTRPDLASDHTTLTSAEPVPQPPFPPLATQASNLFQSVVAFVGDGCGIVDDEQYRRRLETCSTCDRRVGKRCSACGCWINVKARGRAFRCPIGRWK